MHDDDLLARVRELRAAGFSPKEIARAMGVVAVGRGTPGAQDRRRRRGGRVRTRGGGVLGEPRMEHEPHRRRARRLARRRHLRGRPGRDGLRDGRPSAPAAAHLGVGSASNRRPTSSRAAGRLGDWQQASAITFGRDGMPFYAAGPYDDANAVMRTLTRTAGEGNFHFLVPVGAAADW
ncbi:MAG: hypothetical protein WKF47_10940 [Geodermatophilaceae bacterium]